MKHYYNLEKKTCTGSQFLPWNKKIKKVIVTFFLSLYLTVLFFFLAILRTYKLINLEFWDINLQF